MKEEKDEERNKYRIDTVWTAGKILEAVAMSREAMGIADIAKALDINLNMALRQCATLAELGLLDRVGDKFRLGMKLALFWARRKSYLEGQRDRVNDELKELGEDDAA